jgi:hypothetical protein
MITRPWDKKNMEWKQHDLNLYTVDSQTAGSSSNACVLLTRAPMFSVTVQMQFLDKSFKQQIDSLY